MSATSETSYCYIGLTQWQHADWQESVLKRAQQASPLRAYAQHLSSVEGNTTFYGLPKDDTVAQWQQDTPEHFRFCFKLPQTITHQRQLRACQAELNEFFKKLAPLQGKLGLLCIQLPKQFSAADIPTLAQFFSLLAADFNYGVEVRHEDFFNKQASEQTFNQLLLQHNINRIHFDTRALFAHPATDPVSLKAKAHKPQVPVHALSTAEQPMIRFITPLDWQWGTTYLTPWINKAVQWLDEGKTPYFFFHTPDNAQAPQLARYFVDELEKRRPQRCLFDPWSEITASQDSLF